MRFLNFIINISFIQALIYPFRPERFAINYGNHKYPLSRDYYEKYMQNLHLKNQTNDVKGEKILETFFKNRNNKYPLSRDYFEGLIRRLNSKNITEQTNEILGNNFDSSIFDNNFSNKTLRIIIGKNSITNNLFNDDNPDYDDNNDGVNDPDSFFRFKKRNHKNGSKKSDNFEIITEFETNFSSVGGYEVIKNELTQCIDLLNNFTKYSKYNVRVPKGLIFEGPPGNGKTLLAKALAGEAQTGYIAVSGSEFQEKYVGVGSARIRELFELAQKNIPCIIFIDEIDALGRNRGSDKESASAERDNTLNELLIALDGFKTKSGIFVIGATNRADLLDPALLRPGRIDKRVFIGNPDEIARKAIIKIHSEGKPRDLSITDEDLVDLTNGFSAAQIENLLNEAMLNALRYNHEKFTQEDLDIVFNKVLVGWQPSEHIFSEEMLDKICIHEMGHAIVGLLARNHSKVKKVVINLSSPNSPGYTLFEKSKNNIYNRDTLFEHLMILLGGRIAEQLFYGPSAVSTGAISDFEEAYTLATKMITYYGMGPLAIYPNNSEKYKEIIDNEITKLLQDADIYSAIIIDNARDFIYEGALLLKKNRVITAEELMHIIESKYPDILDIRV
jgi:cell division protease FtsH